MERSVIRRPPPESRTRRPAESPPRSGRAGEELLEELQRTLEEAFAGYRNRTGANLTAARAVIDGALASARTEILCGEGDAVREEIPNFVHLTVLMLADPEDAERARLEARGGLADIAAGAVR